MWLKELFQKVDITRGDDTAALWVDIDEHGHVGLGIGEPLAGGSGRGSARRESSTEAYDPAPVLLSGPRISSEIIHESPFLPIPT